MDEPAQTEQQFLLMKTAQQLGNIRQMRVSGLGGDDSLLFTIDVDGNLSFNEAPDFGDPNSSSGDNNYQLFNCNRWCW